MTTIPASARRLVESRASRRCEYCLLPAAVSFFSHEVDHIVALKHGGKTNPQNLAYACWRCNRFKGTDLGSFDPETGLFSFLFNPRDQTWAEHFQLQDNCVNGLTPEGRTTVHLLQLNSDERRAERQRAAANRADDL
ncbi:HNH endonuclease [Nodosilinea sp. LEGE 07088]|uniref:HNH endonuclease n=1 Tax=Nodosilinea sp. LEGE 07088 TaxID=2777968 RepID=UPI00187E7498|nr:HNH endonuclease signature motif containing protein [Nodosilinea sp. LEGE 07088]MBE9138836.1 HNH endonuclease [Nodosilinea sp. LEGE 07088]